MLAGAGREPMTLFIHHPPVPDRLVHFRNIGLHDAEAVLAPLRAHPGEVRHIVFGHIHAPLAGTSREDFAYSSGEACSHRFITDPGDPGPRWTDGNPCYRVIMIDDLGFRAYAVEVGQPRISRAQICAGP